MPTEQQTKLNSHTAELQKLREELLRRILLNEARRQQERQPTGPVPRPNFT
jgi:hypothetical protein